MIKKFESFVNEGKSNPVVDKDWKRMSDLVLSKKDASGVAKSITNKDKAIARFVCGLKLSGSQPDYRWGSYLGHFSEFGNQALELGATTEEIQSVFDQTEIPAQYTEKIDKLSSKKLSNRFVGFLVKNILDAGFDIEFLPHNGYALTREGQNAMSRNGRKWTIGYKTEIDLGDKKVSLNFDAITDEGDGPTSYVIDRSSDRMFTGLYGSEAMGKLAFNDQIMRKLTDR